MGAYDKLPMMVGALSSHDREENDFYATDPISITSFLKENPPIAYTVWEPACGNGNMAKALIDANFEVVATDKYDRGFGQSGIDFLKCEDPFDGDIITNPPFKYACEFAEKGLSLIKEGHAVWLFMKLQFLEGTKRQQLFKRKELKTVYVSVRRIKCAMNGDFDAVGAPVMAYAWYEFRKGYNGDPAIKWFNGGET